MTITRIGSTSTTVGTSVSLPIHQAGDLIIIFAFNRGSTTLPTPPTASGTVPSWIFSRSRTSVNLSGVVYYALASASTTTSGTWSNTSQIATIVYRGASSLVNSNAAGLTAGSTSLITYPVVSIPAGGFSTDVAFRVAYHTTATDVNSAVFSGWVLAGASNGSSTTGEYAAYTTLSSISPITSANDTVNSSGSYVSFTFVAKAYARQKLIADLRAYTATVSSANLIRVFVFSADAASFQFSASDASLNRSLIADSGSGNFYVAGADASLTTGTFIPPLAVLRGRFQAEGLAALFFYDRRFDAGTTSHLVSGSDVSFPRGYYLNPQSADFTLEGPAPLLAKAVIFYPARGVFSVARPGAGLGRGFYLSASPAPFSAPLVSVDLYRYARLLCESNSLLTAAHAIDLLRDLRVAFTHGIFSLLGFGAGTRNTPGMPPSGQPTLPPLSPYGGSDRTGGLSIAPHYVQFNSFQKSKDYGLVNNLTARVAGSVGSQAGTNTIYIRAETDGPAQILIRKSNANQYTSKYIDVGILDENRKPITLTANGFAYSNDNYATAEDESLRPLPPSTYYFTITTSQWQAIPFEVFIQIFRYRELSGVITGTLTPYGRFANAKLYGTALLAFPATGSIPSRTTLKLINGATTATVQPSLSLAIMRGVASGSMQPYGRLKQTHRITGQASLGNANVATLSSAPPYGSGY